MLYDHFYDLKATLEGEYFLSCKQVRKNQGPGNAAQDLPDSDARSWALALRPDAISSA